MSSFVLKLLCILFYPLRDVFKLNNDNYQKMIRHKTDKLCESKLSRDELQPEIHRVNIMLRDWILFIKDFLKCADQSNFRDSRKFECIYDTARAYRLICLRSKKNVEANLKNSIPYIQRMVCILQRDPELFKSCGFLPTELISHKKPEEDWVDFLVDYIDGFCYPKKFRNY